MRRKSLKIQNAFIGLTCRRYPCGPVSDRTVVLTSSDSTPCPASPVVTLQACPIAEREFRMLKI